MTDLSRELRNCRATNNAAGAERMMVCAADAIDALVGALALIAASGAPLKSGVVAVMDAALLKTEA